MARWSQSQYQDVVGRGRMDGEYHSHSARNIENHLVKSGVTLSRLRDCCEKITSGHTPLRHNLNLGDVFFVTVECVSPLLIEYGLTKRVHISHYYGELSRVALTSQCVVVTIKRRIAQASPCYGLRGETVVNQDVAVLRLLNGWNPGYIASYLISKIGQQLADREKTEQMNPYLPVNKLGNLLIPRIGISAQQSIDDLVKQRFECLAESEKAYAEARHFLESELGLDKLSFHKSVGYTARFSEAMTGGRIDADFFQPPFRLIHTHINKYPRAQLHTLVDISKGIEVGSSAYHTDGYLFVRVSNIKEMAIEKSGSDKYISSGLYTKLKDYKPQIGELLLTKDGSPGVALSVDQECEGITSGGVVRLKPKNDYIPNEYLALVINSRACRMQVERECSGAIILHWKPGSIRKLMIPILPKPVMEKIAALVKESKYAKRKAEELLDQAKTRVEQLIEEAVRS